MQSVEWKMKNGKYRMRNWECGMESGKKSGEWRKGRGKQGIWNEEWRVESRLSKVENVEWRIKNGE